MTKCSEVQGSPRSSEASARAEAVSRTAAPGPFPGWRMVAAAFLAQGVSTGATIYVYGLFLVPIASEFGASRMVAGLGLSAMYAVQALASPAVGRALDRRSIRSIMLWGVLALGGGLALLSATTTLWQAGLVFAAVVGVGTTMVGPLSAATLVANWFVRNRGRALGVAALGTSFFGFVLPPVTAAGIAALGWRAACLGLGVGAAAILAPILGAVVVSRPEERGFEPDGLARAGTPGPDRAATPSVWSAAKLLREPRFWAIAGGIGLIAGATVALLTHLVAFATDRAIAPQRASLLLSVVAGFGMAGKLCFGAIADRVEVRRAFWLMVGTHALAWLILLSEPGFPGMLAAAAVFGLGTGGNLPVSGALVGATFGRAAFGTVMGWMNPVILLLTLVTPPLAGYLYDRTGSYELAFRLLFVITIAAALPVMFLRAGPAEASPAHAE